MAQDDVVTNTLASTPVQISHPSTHHQRLTSSIRTWSLLTLGKQPCDNASVQNGSSTFAHCCRIRDGVRLYKSEDHAS